MFPLESITACLWFSLLFCCQERSHFIFSLQIWHLFSGSTFTCNSQGPVYSFIFNPFPRHSPYLGPFGVCVLLFCQQDAQGNDFNPLWLKSFSGSGSKEPGISCVWRVFPLRGSHAFWYRMSCQHFQLNTSLINSSSPCQSSSSSWPPGCANGTRMSHINFVSCTRLLISQLIAKWFSAHINHIHRLNSQICFNYFVLMKLDPNSWSAFQCLFTPAVLSNGTPCFPRFKGVILHWSHCLSLLCLEDFVFSLLLVSPNSTSLLRYL